MSKTIITIPEAFWSTTMEAAEGRWRRLNGHHPVALVRAGAEFKNADLLERNEQKDTA